jgi:glyoxylase-like metal-dependent hydrolase (beta-lactamase superfamily II)
MDRLSISYAREDLMIISPDKEAEVCAKGSSTQEISGRHSEGWIMCEQKKALRVAGMCALIVAGILWSSAGARAQFNGKTTVTNQTLIDENAVEKVSDHVYAILTYPNIEIIVGDRATMVVDTGLGKRNGEAIMRAEQKLAKGPILYLTNTHFHPEHSSGEEAFPANTVLIRPKEMQVELEKNGARMVALFSSNTPQNKALLQDVHFRMPDVLFEGDMKVDLGGVTVRMFWVGPAHTIGDQLIYVEEDRTLIPGDIVQNKLIPNLYGDDASAKGWIAALDKAAALNPKNIVPDHGALGDASLIAQERAFLVYLRGRVLELKSLGKSVDEILKLMTDEVKAKYPDWSGRPDNGVKSIYKEGE